MPQLSNVTLKNSADQDQVFGPRDISNGVATLVKSNGVPLADKRMAVSHTRTPNGREKVSFKFTVPVVQDATVNGVTKPVVVRTAYMDIAITVDATSTATERADLRWMMTSLATSAFATDMIDDLEYLY